ncbi:MAG TPA: hypothetical protein VGJ75_13565 [Dongiaceae bacterium]
MAAFDVSKQSPEDIARLFERWKQQRKRLEPDEPPAKPARSTRFMPVIVRTPAPAEAAPAPVAAEPPPEPAPIRYSAPFADILAASGKGTVAQQVRTFALGPVARQMPRVAARRSKARLVLAGAASVLAVAAASATVLWQYSAPQQVAAVQAQVAPAAHSGMAHTHQASLPVEVVSAPPEIQTASRLLPLVLQPPQERGDWQLALEVALLGPTPAEAEAAQVHLDPKLKPKAAAVQTASKAARKPATAVESEPEPNVVTSTDVRRADDPRAISVAVPPAPAPVASAAPDKRPDVFYQHGNDKEFGGGFGAHASASTGKGHGSTGGGSTGAGSGNSGGGATGGNTGGSGAGGATGGDAGGSTGGGSTGNGSGGSGSGAGGASGGGDTGGGDTGSGGGSGSSAGSGDGSSGGSGESGGSGADSGSSKPDKPDKPGKGADVSAGVGIGGGGVSASVGGHVGGIGGGVSAGIGN